jgi:hypothetical protein
MTPEELTAMKERFAKAEAQIAAVDRAKAALAEAEQLTPADVACAGVQPNIFSMVVKGHKTLLIQAAEMHAQKFIDDIKAQLRAHLAVQEKKLAEI